MDPIHVTTDPGLPVAEYSEFSVHQSDGATEPITQAMRSASGTTAQVSLEAPAYIATQHDDGSDEENGWSSLDESDLVILKPWFFLRLLCAGDQDDGAPLPTKMLAYHYALILRHPVVTPAIPQIPLLSNCWSYWASSLLERSNSGLVSLRRRLDKLIVRWTITISDNRTPTERHYWSMYMNVGVMEPLPEEAFQPTRPDDDEKFSRPLYCKQRGFIPDIDRHSPGFEHQLLVSYLIPGDTVEVQTDEVFDHGHIWHPPQNTFARYAQRGVGWARCYWCWRWRFSIGYHIGGCPLADPLCDRCRLMKEPPWYPNNRQRAILYFQHALSQQQNRYHEILVLQAETLAAFLADPREP